MKKCRFSIGKCRVYGGDLRVIVWEVIRFVFRLFRIVS